MTVYTGEQAREMILKDKYPIGSIGVCKALGGYAYWFWDGHTFDSGVEETEAEAIAMAKKNWR